MGNSERFDANWDAIPEAPAAEDDDIDELTLARRRDSAAAEGDFEETLFNLQDRALRENAKRRQNRRKPTAAGQRPAGRPQGGSGQQAPHGAGQAGQGPTTPRGVAVMSNSVHSIGRRKKSLIRRSEPQLVATSLNAMRLMLALLFRVRAKSDHGFEEVKLSIAELGRTIGLAYRMSREMAEELLQSLNSVDFTCRSDTGRFVTAPFMGISELDESGTTACLQLNDNLEPYLLNLQKNYRQLLPSVLELQSVRSMLLYILARRYINLRWLHRPRVPFAELLSAMQVREQTPWAAFHKDYLKPAVAEINRRTELRIEYCPERGGHRKRGEIETVRFEVAEKVGRKSVDAEQAVAGADQGACKVLIEPRKPVEVRP